MFRVTMEVIPDGIEQTPRKSMVVEITNVLDTTDGKLSDFLVDVVDGDETFKRVPRFTICRWRRDLGILGLLIRVLEGVDRYVKLA